jgi:Alkaline and neutral invertase
VIIFVEVNRIKIYNIYVVRICMTSVSASMANHLLGDKKNYPNFFLVYFIVLLWLLTAACIKAGRPQIARRAIMLAESRLQKDGWPEYYDGTLGRYVGKQARKFQTWSIAGYLVSKMLLEDPSNLGMISLGEDKAMKPLIKRSASWTCAKPSKEDT